VLALAALVRPGASSMAAVVPVGSLDLRQVQQADWTVPRPAEAAGGGPLRVGRQSFPDGFGTTGCSRLDIELDGRAESLEARTGVDDSAGPLASARFLVVGDGRVLYRGPWQQRHGSAVALGLGLRGVRRLALVVDVRGEPYVRADWLSPMIAFGGAAPVAAAPPSDGGAILAPPPAEGPCFNMPAAVGVRPGHPFLQRVDVAGIRPLHLSAQGLPAGITLDARRQVLEGFAPSSPGTWMVRLRAENGAGAAACALRVVVGETLALTPPQGWSGWYCLAGRVSDRLVREAADALLRTGLADHGWTFVLLDDFVMRRPGPDDPALVRARSLERLGRQAGYFKKVMDDPAFSGPLRDAQGRLRPSARFPDLPALTAWLHAAGLKAGIYSSPGSLTCAGCTGSLGHEEQDATLFAAWGFDLLKYDWCGYYLETGRLEREDWEWPYVRMGRFLRAQPRDLVFGLCEYGMADVWTWGPEAGGQMWRVSQDLKDSWGGISGAGFFGVERDRFAGPGRWNDLDYLMLGRIGMGGEPRAVALTRDEQRTHFALWCLRSSPLILGGDPRSLDAGALALLTNDAVIAIDRDPLALPARRVVLDDRSEAWVKPLAGGAAAVGFFNRDEEAMGVEASWARLGLPGAWRVRDLWRGRPVEGAARGWAGSVPRHGVELFRLEPASD
jgi:alpha-galactosidase